MKFIKENLNLIVYIIIMCTITILMFFYIEKKEGFHEDEIFSYGASNSTLGNTFLSYRRSDNLDTILKTDSPIESVKNWIYYKLNPGEYSKAEEELNLNTYNSIWRTQSDAIEYLKIDTPKEAIDFFTVFWNTAKDVHPPLFYFAVHIVSIFFYNTFSKYIIFIVNLIFFLATCVLLRKIFKKIEKEYLAIPNLILYGASIGAISTVMFQRMYMMLTFFTIYFLYTNLKIYYNEFILNKKLKIELCVITILGFLTQYYFCIYAACLALVMIILSLKKKDKKLTWTYIFQFIKSAIIGVLVFLPCIYHIFFSYRGAGSAGNGFTYLENLIEFVKNTYLAFSIPNKIGLIISAILFVLLIIKFVKSNKKELYLIFIIPVILNFILVVKMSPYRSLRYVMNILPIITLVVLYLIDDFIKNKKVSVYILSILAIGLSVYGLATNPVKYLYIGYNEYLKIAEENKDCRFLLICSTEFNHIQDAPEFGIYRESMIVAPKNLDDLKEVKEFEEEDEFILSIKNWLDYDKEEILNTVLENTGFTKYELLYDSEKAAKCKVYKITK